MAKANVEKNVRYVWLLWMVLSTACGQVWCQEWAIPMRFKIHMMEDSLAFGVATGATEDLDPGIDILNPPPPPNPAAFDAYFEIDHPLFPRLSEDFRSDTAVTLTWQLLIERTSGQAGTMFWDASQFPSGQGQSLILYSFTQIDTISTDMLGVDSLEFTGNQEMMIRMAPLTGFDFGNQDDQLVQGFYLAQNFPNPFNPSTTIKYVLPKDGFTRLSIYDVLGKRIAVLVDRQQTAGAYTVIWDGKDREGFKYPGGTYFYQITAAGFVAAKRMLLVQ